MSLTISNLRLVSPCEDDSSSSLPAPSDDLSSPLSRTTSPLSQPTEHELTLCGIRSPDRLTHYHECHNRMCLCSSPPLRRNSYRSEHRLLIVNTRQEEPTSPKSRVRLKIRLESPDLRDPPPTPPIRSIRASSVNTLMHHQRKGSPFTYIETTSIRRKQAAPYRTCVQLKDTKPLSTQHRHKTIIFHKLGDEPRSPPTRYSNSINLVGFNRVISTKNVPSPHDLRLMLLVT